ncbi:hypothetical protein QCA50_015019 [Cerrena zonata]|uniref:Uncharacterized protein n=1 Tax=Cerrena zonata TaxID=2478898 RepID=A0AAW0FT69_9APHY
MFIVTRIQEALLASTAVISLLKLREQNHYEGSEGETAMHETPQNRLTTFVDLEIASCASSRAAAGR